MLNHALGADYDLHATPGLIERVNEFYSVPGATRLCEVIPTFAKGRAIVGVTSTPLKCPPAPSEAALLLHNHLTSPSIATVNNHPIPLVVPAHEQPSFGSI